MASKFFVFINQTWFPEGKVSQVDFIDVFYQVFKIEVAKFGFLDWRNVILLNL